MKTRERHTHTEVWPLGKHKEKAEKQRGNVFSSNGTATIRYPAASQKQILALSTQDSRLIRSDHWPKCERLNAAPSGNHREVSWL